MRNVHDLPGISIPHTFTLYLPSDTLVESICFTHAFTRTQQKPFSILPSIVRAGIQESHMNMMKHVVETIELPSKPAEHKLSLVASNVVSKRRKMFMSMLAIVFMTVIVNLFCLLSYCPPTVSTVSTEEAVSLPVHSVEVAVSNISSIPLAPVLNETEEEDVDYETNYECREWRGTGKCPGRNQIDRTCDRVIRGNSMGYCHLYDTVNKKDVHFLTSETCEATPVDVRFKCEDAVEYIKLAPQSERLIQKARSRVESLDRSNHAANDSRGIVMVVYPPQLAAVYSSIHLLRDHGCKLPIELWYMQQEIGDASSNPVLQKLVEEDAQISLQEIRDPSVQQFHTKIHAVRNSKLDKVLFLDADNVPVRDPTYLFDSNAFAEKGAVFWPDFWHPNQTIFNDNPSSVLWEIIGMGFVDMFEFESAQMLIDRKRAQVALELVDFYASYKPNPFEKLKLVHGDKDLFRLAWLKSETRFHFIPYPPGTAGFMRWKGAKSRRDQYCGMTMVQHDMDGNPVFFHRNSKKVTGKGEDAQGKLAWTHIQQFNGGTEYDVVRKYYRTDMAGEIRRPVKVDRCVGNLDMASEYFNTTEAPYEDLESSLLRYATEAANLLV